MAFDGKIEGFPEFRKTRANLLARARELSWYHTIRLDESFTSQGEFDLYPYVGHYLPCFDLSRADCLDVGSGNGFWAFELEKRDARSVTASDLADFSETDFSILHDRDADRPTGRSAPGAFGEQLRIAACLAGSRLSYLLCSVYDLQPEKVGTFDLVHCGSVLMHLFGPLTALHRMAAVCRDSFLVTTEVDLSSDGESTLHYRGHQVPFVHFVPSPTCLVNMLAACGYERVLRGPTFFLRFRDPHNPQLVPHTTCIGLKQGSTNILGLPRFGPVDPESQDVSVEFTAVTPAAVPGQAIDVLLRIINRSGRMWHAQGAADAIVAGCGWELHDNDRVVASLATRDADAVPTVDLLPPGLGTLVGVKVQVPPREGALRLKPFVAQGRREFRVAAAVAAIDVCGTGSPPPSRPLAAVPAAARPRLLAAALASDRRVQRMLSHPLTAPLRRPYAALRRAARALTQ